jgi:hypothetical protein
MNNTSVRSDTILLPVLLNAVDRQWLVVGGGEAAKNCLRLLVQQSDQLDITVVGPEIAPEIHQMAASNPRIRVYERSFEISDLEGVHLLIAATDSPYVDEKIRQEAGQRNILVYAVETAEGSDFILSAPPTKANVPRKKRDQWFQFWRTSDQSWKSFTSKLILVFFLMVLGHIIISYLPLPSVKEIWGDVRPYFDYKFLFFVVAGFLAQMVDGVLGMGYGVTSATCLITFGINPVMVSSAIHTSEIFTTGISGYSHYKFGNVNKKLFKHLVIPGVVGSILGAILLVFLGEKYGKWLMPAIAIYAGFLGFKILIKAFQQNPKTKKIKRIGWLAWMGGFFDSFGGGGWGPIVTSNLISKGRSPKYTIGSVNLTEFFVTLSSAVTFFLTVGVSNWNVVLGLLIGGGIASPLAAKLTGKLPRKTMMIAVGIMVMIWCVRMFIKSLI